MSERRSPATPRDPDDPEPAVARVRDELADAHRGNLPSLSASELVRRLGFSRDVVTSALDDLSEADAVVSGPDGQRWSLVDPPEETDLVQCEECRRLFRGKNGYSTHYRTAHDERPSAWKLRRRGSDLLAEDAEAAMDRRPSGDDSWRAYYDDDGGEA